ncbi:hypothetical protein HZA26_04410 [Candidatus Nomurabacteria bacterium]|nr:hypothetical protein [Candidatus Nomurabacteria bacterium]
MGYYARVLKPKHKPQYWKLQFVSHKKVHASNSKAKKPKKEWDISKSRWYSLGFQSKMTIDQARTRALLLNAKLHTKRHEERRLVLEKKATELEICFTAAIPELYKQEFEQKYVFGRFNDLEWRKRFLRSWRAVQKMLLQIQLDPADWYDEMYRFYDYFYEQKYSFSYIRKILQHANLRGYFLSRKLGQPFIKVPMPRGKEKERLLEIYFQKKGRYICESDPITPKQLENARSKLNQLYYNWLYLSVWLCLRPREIDQLHDQSLFRLQKLSKNSALLWVYQTKLVSVPPRYRWKLIPIVFRGQANAVKIIESGLFKRPLNKTVRYHFGKHTTLYGGRKGFTDLMLDHQQQLENISQWMGHSSIERTWKNYKSRLITHYTLIEKGNI